MRCWPFGAISNGGQVLIAVFIRSWVSLLWRDATPMVSGACGMFSDWIYEILRRGFPRHEETWTPSPLAENQKNSL